MIKNKKIMALGLIIILIIAGIISLKRYIVLSNEPQETEFVINREIRGKFNLLGLEMKDLDQSLEDPVVETAFGFTIGDVFNPNKALNEHRLSTGTTLYEIKPIIENKGNGRFYVTTNSSNNKITSLRGMGIFDSLEDAKKEMSMLEIIINQRWDLVSQGENYKYYRDAGGSNDLLLVFIKQVGDKHELHLHRLGS